MTKSGRSVATSRGMAADRLAAVDHQPGTDLMRAGADCLEVDQAPSVSARSAH